MRKAVLYFASALWAALVIAWPEESNVAVTAVDKSGPASGEELYKSSLTQANFGLLGVNFYESDNGKKRWNIKAQFAELHRKENYSFMQTVDADFYAEKTHNLIHTKSNFGKSFMDKNRVELYGDVSVRSRRGYLFQMEHLNYDGKSHEVTTEDMVKMRGPSVSKPSMYLRGTGLKGDIDNEHFFLRKNVTAQKQLKSGEWMRISSKNGEFFTEDQKALFGGKVHSVFPGTELDSDRLELKMADDKESLEAKGHVNLKNKNRVGSAESAFIELGGNKIILDGKARIDSKDNQITGNRIVLFTDEDRVEVEQAEGRAQN
jgi:LPS export ABC transporter protein LptC/lipopolysaccharide transport protein LptA